MRKMFYTQQATSTCFYAVIKYLQFASPLFSPSARYTDSFIRKCIGLLQPDRHRPIYKRGSPYINKEFSRYSRRSFCAEVPVYSTSSIYYVTLRLFFNSWAVTGVSLSEDVSLRFSSQGVQGADYITNAKIPGKFVYFEGLRSCCHTHYASKMHHNMHVSRRKNPKIFWSGPLSRPNPL